MVFITHTGVILAGWGWWFVGGFGVGAFPDCNVLATFLAHFPPCQNLVKKTVIGYDGACPAVTDSGTFTKE